ncbi:hypothetical protein PG984_016210 [Apiospora sp. TS-2023a]
MAATPDTAATPVKGKRGAPKTHPSNRHKRKGKFKAKAGEEEMIKIEEKLGIQRTDLKHVRSLQSHASLPAKWQRFHHWRRDGIEENSWRLDQQLQRPRPEVFSWLRALRSHYGKEHVRTSAHARDTEKHVDRPYWRPLLLLFHGSCHIHHRQLDVANRLWHLTHHRC